MDVNALALGIHREDEDVVGPRACEVRLPVLEVERSPADGGAIRERHVEKREAARGSDRCEFIIADRAGLYAKNSAEHLARWNGRAPLGRLGRGELTRVDLPVADRDLHLYRADALLEHDRRRRGAEVNCTPRGEHVGCAHGGMPRERQLDRRG